MDAIDNIVVQLAFFYDEQLRIGKTEKEPGVPNPRVVEVLKWFRRNFKSEENAKRFATKVKHLFKPTSAVPFPTMPFLNEIQYIDFQVENDLDDNKRYGELNSQQVAQLSMSNALQSYADNNGVSLNAPEGIEIDFFQVWNESRDKSNFIGALQKYGIMTVWEAYRQHFKDEPRGRDNPEYFNK